MYNIESRDLRILRLASAVLFALHNLLDLPYAPMFAASHPYLRYRGCQLGSIFPLLIPC